MSYDLLRTVEEAVDTLRVMARALERPEPPAPYDELVRTAHRLRQIAADLAEQVRRDREYARRAEPRRSE